MNICWSLCLILCSHYAVSRDFYIGMFKKNDFLVAQDAIFKEARHFGYVVGSYGRLFKCPITYFRIVDRLGTGRGPITSIVRGGLRQKYIAVKIKSAYSLPLSVNIYVGCENKKPPTIKRIIRSTTTAQVITNVTDGGQGKTDGGDGGEGKGGKGEGDGGKGEGDGGEGKGDEGKGDEGKGGEGDKEGDGGAKGATTAGDAVVEDTTPAAT